jgi:phosphotriesterase-related protein
MSDFRPFIRTALGDIDPGHLGPTSAHEHVIIDDEHVRAAWPDFDLGDVRLAAQELSLFHAAGGRAVVDTMPAGCGRNAGKVAEASRKSGVHVVLATGVHLVKYYRPDHWLLGLDESEMADLLVADIQVGIRIDEHDPHSPRGPQRAGVIKVAGGRSRLDDFQQRTFRAAADAQRRTGCPVITHTEQGTAAFEQAELLIAHGAHRSHVVLSHVDRVHDAAVHRRVLELGVCLEYDAAFRARQQPNPTVALLAELAPAYPSQLTVGMDLARLSYKESSGGTPGLAWLMHTLWPLLRQRGLSEELIHRLYVENPAAVFSFFQPPAAIG